MSEDIEGPVATLGLFGQKVREYLIRFDAEGQCLSVQSRADLLAHIDQAKITDVILYSHGWNTDFASARTTYEAFLTGLSDMAERLPGHLPPGFKPVFLGVIWPSTALEWPSEKAPVILGGAQEAAEEAAEDFTEDFSGALSLLDQGLARTLQDRLTRGAALDGAEFATLTRAFVVRLPRDPSDPEAQLAEEAISVWGELAQIRDRQTQDGGFSGFGGAAADPGVPAIAGGFPFDPRILLRIATVMQMKDRAGVVGRKGVAETLGLLLQTPARLHLLGHSYGAKVVSAALTHQTSGKKAHSMLLLQPAFNHLAFAPDIGQGQAGAYRAALDRLKTPLLATHSVHDFPLHKVFHLILRRKTDVGDLQFAATKVSRFAALGGYGPPDAGDEVAQDRVPQVSAPLAKVAPSVRLIGLDGKDAIKGHSDVTHDRIFWTFLKQLAEERPSWPK